MESDHVAVGIDKTPQFSLPLIFWTNDSAYRAYELKMPWILDKRTVAQKNKYCKIMRIIDASGKLFIVERLKEIPPTGKISKLIRKYSWNTRVVPVVVAQKQLSLEQFKKEVKRAVSARQKYDLDSNIFAETMKKLPNATSYIEAIDSLPKLI